MNGFVQGDHEQEVDLANDKHLWRLLMMAQKFEAELSSSLAAGEGNGDVAALSAVYDAPSR